MRRESASVARVVSATLLLIAGLACSATRARAAEAPAGTGTPRPVPGGTPPAASGTITVRPALDESMLINPGNWKEVDDVINLFKRLGKKTAYRLGIQGRTAAGWYVVGDKLAFGP